MLANDALTYMNEAFQGTRKLFTNATKHWWEKQNDKGVPIIGTETLSNSCRVELLDEHLTAPITIRCFGSNVAK